MPLNLRVPNAAAYVDAVLPTMQTLDEVISTLPGLVGAWDAADYSSGAWAPRLGTGQILLNGDASPQSRDGRAVIRFGVTGKAFVNNAGGANLAPSSLTWAQRAYFSDMAANFQKVFDLGAPEFFVRPTAGTPCWQWKDAANLTTNLALEGGAVARWRRFIFTKAGTAVPQLEADGAGATAIGAGGAALGSAAALIGDQANAVGAVQDIARLIVCTEATLTAQQRQAINTWLAS